MAKVIYTQGTKATYLGLIERLPNALYFCTDTKELFKGDDLYSDGIRIVSGFTALPAFNLAADGIIYFCEDTGCGYVLNLDRDGWIPVMHGVDGESIELDDNGLMRVKAIPMVSVSGLTERLEQIEHLIEKNTTGIASVDKAGLVKASSEIFVSQDGMMGISPIAITKVLGLEDRLTGIEKSIVGGVRYCGSVDTINELPVDAAQGDMYEVRGDNSEWCFNGEKWFEYGTTVDTSRFISKDAVRSIAKMVQYEISDKPVGTLVNYYDKEIRVMCPSTTKWEKQNVGSTGNPNMYYMGFKAYAPDGAVSFKEGDRGVIVDEMFTFDDDFAGTDEFGRNYSICWLALANYDEASGVWTYYGDKSTTDKYVGWDYIVEWYDAYGIMIASDSIRINLANETCYSGTNPYYLNELRSVVSTVEDAYTWGDM